MKLPPDQILHTTAYGYVARNGHCGLQIAFGRLFWSLSIHGFDTFSDYIAHLLTDTGTRSNRLPDRNQYLVAMENDCLTVSLDRNELGQLIDLLDGAAVELQRMRLEKLYAEVAA